MNFAAFAAQNGAACPDDLPAHVDPFVQMWLHTRGHQAEGRSRRGGLSSFADELRRPILQLLRRLLPERGFSRTVRPLPFAETVPDFFDALHEERGLRPSTLQLYASHLRLLERFLQRQDGIDLQTLSPSELEAFMRECSATQTPASLAPLFSHLRIFLRYLHREGLLNVDLSVHVDGPRHYRLATLPRAINWDDITQLLAAVDRRSAVGKRDYALLVLLTTYGLRAREVAALTLEDIDWVHERLAVPARKGGHASAYPLSPGVGEALVEYLQHGRATSNQRAVFLRMPAPHDPMTHSAISECVGKRIKRAGIAVARPGSHTLRHSCVTRLVERGFSLKAIGDYVGHRHPKSTQIYTKLDLEALRELALGDGEVLL
ncbi:site-specific integrase [Ectothiorhodospira sp. BSL-9]|uniref:tyrosine-type recombinase/integrase n=1 Tax=Ectothiorhodospira sp. BSL-9 TaxID=1442136 RepID=UPI0007B527D2|nr:site-specific integrase [Ectothiorhodospira sp. BSL-9]